MASSNDNAILGKKKVLFVYVIHFPFTKLREVKIRLMF